MQMQNIYECNISKEEIFKKIEENTHKDPSGVDVFKALQENIQSLKSIIAARNKEELEKVLTKKLDHEYMGFHQDDSFVISYISKRNKYITCLYGKIKEDADTVKVYCECRENNAQHKIKKLYGFFFMLVGLFVGIDSFIKGQELFVLFSSLFFILFGVMFAISPKKQKEREEMLYAFFEKIFKDNILSKKEEYIDPQRSEKIESVAVEVNWIRVVKGLTIALIGIIVPLFVVPFLVITKPYDTLTRIVIFVLLCLFSYSVVTTLGKSKPKKDEK